MDRFLEEADGGIVIRRKIRSLTRIVSRSREGGREREVARLAGRIYSGGSKERLLASGRPHAVIINSGGMHYRDAGSVGEQPPGTRIYLATPSFSFHVVCKHVLSSIERCFLYVFFHV